MEMGTMEDVSACLIHKLFSTLANVQTQDDILKVTHFPGCIHALAFDDKGTQLAIGFGEQIVLIKLDSFCKILLVIINVFNISLMTY